MAGASPSWEIPKITPPLKLSDHVSRRAVRDCGTACGCSGVQPHFDCPPRLNGRHHSYSSRSYCAAPRFARGESRLRYRSTLGGVALHSSHPSLGAAFATASARGQDSHRKHKAVALPLVSSPDLGTDRLCVQRLARPEV